MGVGRKVRTTKQSAKDGTMSKIETARQVARTAVEKRGEYLTMACPISLNAAEMLRTMQIRKAAEAAYIAAMRTAAEFLNTLTSEELATANGTAYDRRNIAAVFGWAKVTA